MARLTAYSSFDVEGGNFSSIGDNVIDITQMRIGWDSFAAVLNEMNLSDWTSGSHPEVNSYLELLWLDGGTWRENPDGAYTWDWNNSMTFDWDRKGEWYTMGIAGTGLSADIESGAVSGTIGYIAEFTADDPSNPEILPEVPTYIIGDFSLALATLAEAMMSSNTTDDAAIIQSIFAKDDTIILSGGNDRMDGFAGNDMLRGNYGHDTLTGGFGNDRLDGGAGNDRLDGGAGSDVLKGGTGADRFIFAVTAETGSRIETADQITDFGASVPHLTDDSLYRSGMLFPRHETR